MLEELPAASNGLSGTERRALEAIANGAPTPATAFLAAQRLEDAPFLGDAWFYRALAVLGEGTPRLVETSEAKSAPAPSATRRRPPFLSDSAQVDAPRRRVLRGELDRVELLGIDRWIGGTHVLPEDELALGRR